jgi:cytoskeletal protein RodZ
VQRSTIGVGPALRKARLAHGVSLPEAARDTKIRPELIQALEEEEFDRLLGDVYVRGALRTYATYLGLSPDKVVSVYASGQTGSTPAVQAAPPALDPAVRVRRRRDSHRLIVMIAATVLVLAAAFGVLTSGEPAPVPAVLPSQAPLEQAFPAGGIQVTVLARRPVEVTVTVDDGSAQTFSLEAGEGRAFEADVALRLELSEGASTQVTVNGRDLGYPGRADRPWHDRYSLDTGGETPSPTA